MAGLTFWTKYVLLCIFLSFCNIMWFYSVIFLAIYMILDLTHEELIDKKARRETLKKICLRRIDRIIKKEKQNLNPAS